LTAPCLICANAVNNETFTVKELQLGMGDVFIYQRCGACGSMQLQNPPADLSRYYPASSYYSFNSALKKPRRNLFRTLQASNLLYNKNNLPGKLLSIGYKPPQFYHWLKGLKAKRNDAILDVGCGNGSLLSRLSGIGFTDLTGIDPFIEADATLGDIKILQKEIYDLQESFDVIMMHHSLEHMFQPLCALQKAYDLLKAGGRLLVRLPIMGHYGWQHYQTLWSGLDAPRHIFIPSEKGFRLLATQAHFTLDKLEYDTLDDVIWNSEQYKQGISLFAPQSRAVTRDNGVFSNEEVERFKTITAAENKKNNGDYAAFYLRKE
jgi:SAM-dependent methyltransferase